MTRRWEQVKADLLADMTPAQRILWDQAVAAARKRYVVEIRRYRGIPRIRAMYRRRKR